MSAGGAAFLLLLALAGACTVIADVDYRAPPDEPNDGLQFGDGGAAGSSNG